MHLTLTLSFAGDGLQLPIQYNYWVQSAVYKILDPEYAEQLHGKGYSGGGRIFRLFTFSRLMGSYRLDRQKGKISFFGPVCLVIASPMVEFCEQMASVLAKEGRMQLGKQVVEVEKVEVESPRITSSAVEVFTLSPITVYSTFDKPEGGRYTCYFDPQERSFSELIHENLTRKWEAIQGEPYSGEKTKIEPLGKTRLHILRYKGTVIKAWSGRFRLEGDPALMQVGLDAGFGAKNAQGFGLCTL